jgi:hypothetical protein
MKTKFLAFAILFHYGLNVSGQKDTVAFKKWCIGVSLNTVEMATDFVIKERLILNGHRTDNSYCLGMFAVYNLKNNWHLRLLGKYTNNKAKETYDYREHSSYAGGSYNIDTLSAKQTIVYISPGLFHDFKYKRLNIYGGLQFVYKHYNPIKANTVQWFYFPDGSLEELLKYHQSSEGGFALGVGAFAGFSLQILKPLFIGAEFSSTYSYYNLGGEIITEKTSVNFVNPSASYYNERSINQQTFKGYGFSNVISSLCLHFNF